MTLWILINYQNETRKKIKLRKKKICSARKKSNNHAINYLLLFYCGIVSFLFCSFESRSDSLSGRGKTLSVKWYQMHKKLFLHIIKSKSWPN